MNDQTPTIMQLLLLSEGHLKGGQGELLRRRIQQDETLQARWKLLRKVSADWGTGVERLENKEVEDVGSIEMLGALLEDELPANEASELEKQIWHSPALLRELIEQYRFSSKEQQHNGVGQNLQQRLFNLFPPQAGSEESDHGSQIQSNQQASLESFADSSAAEPPKVKRVLAEPTPPPFAGRERGDRSELHLVESNPSRVVVRRVILSLGLAASVLFIACIAALAWDLLQPPAQVTRDDDGEQSEKIEKSNRNALEQIENEIEESANEFEESGDQDGLANGGLPPGFWFPRNVEQSRNENDESEIRFPKTGIAQDTSASDPDKEDSAMDPEAWLTDSGNNDDLPDWDVENKRLLAMQWKRVTGLLAIRDSVRGNWIGASGVNAESQQQMFATMAGSWANADLGSFGEVVLREDTMASIDLKKLEGEEVLQVRLVYGSVAFKELSSGQRLAIEILGNSTTIQALTDETQLAFSMESGRAWLVVRRGEVNVNGTVAAIGERVELTSMRTVPSETKLTASDTRWFDRPERGATIPKRIQEELLVSVDLEKDLKTWRESNNETVRAMGISWGMTLYPHTFGMETVAAEDHSVREIGIEWLLAQDPSKEYTRRLWRMLAQESSDPATVRSIYRWAAMAREGQRLPQADAQQMIRVLNHESVAVRHAVGYLLSLAFGNAYGYKPDLDAAQRRLVISRWQRQIADSYTGRRPNSSSPNNRRGGVR